VIRRLRPRSTVLTAAVLLTTIAFVGAAAPANAVTFDGQPVRITAHFTVAGHPYTLRDVSVGTATQIVHIGQHSGRYPSRYRLVLKDSAGHVIAKVHRGLYQQSALLTTFSDATFPTVRSFAKAEHRALHLPTSTAKHRWLKDLRIQSVGADLESSIGVALDYLDRLPAGTAPDFDRVEPVHSNEYRGDVTVSGTDATHWSVIVRDEQDGYGEFFDDASHSESTFRF
jgi:hypothetical protein